MVHSFLDLLDVILASRANELVWLSEVSFRGVCGAFWNALNPEGDARIWVPLLFTLMPLKLNLLLMVCSEDAIRMVLGVDAGSARVSGNQGGWNWTIHSNMAENNVCFQIPHVRAIKNNLQSCLPCITADVCVQITFVEFHSFYHFYY